jgi:hypothetical protein
MKNKIIILDETEYVLVPKRPKDDIKNKLPKTLTHCWDFG